MDETMTWEKWGRAEGMKERQGQGGKQSVFRD
jgi:hypothetical protein